MFFNADSVRADGSDSTKRLRAVGNIINSCGPVLPVRILESAPPGQVTQLRMSKDGSGAEIVPDIDLLERLRLSGGFLPMSDNE